MPRQIKNMRSFFAITYSDYIFVFSSIANDESNVIEPILPTNYHIAYQSIEANRQEVNKENIFMFKSITIQFKS